jgi:peptidoglycan/LPS O-acetylase OafA/YrhL
MQNADAVNQQDSTTEKSIRLHYLDWLLVLAILGVILFHSMHPFDLLGDWIIKNAELSAIVTLFSGFIALWGMPFFFLMAGATSWISLGRRTVGQYIKARITRLLIPFIVGTILLTPIQVYYELIHKGWWKGGSIIEFILSSEVYHYYFFEFHPLIFGLEFFGRVGYHLWFVAFLFLFALITLPGFLWLKKDSGKQFVASLARLAKWRGGLLMFVIPMILARFVLQQDMPSDDYGLADFVYYLLFFISGYVLIANEHFLKAIHRDWWLYLILGIPCTLFFFSMEVIPVWDWMGSPGTPGFYLSWTLHGINSWCWIMVMFRVGMWFLDYTNKWLQYLREASYPVFIVHQPIIVFIAFYVVQWEVNLVIKLLVVVIGSFAISFSLFELLVRRINPIRALFGMKPRTK